MQYGLIDHPVNYKAVQDYMMKHYVRLTHISINKEVVKHIFMEHVISRKQKIEIQNLEAEDRMERLLDKIIFPRS